MTKRLDCRTSRPLGARGPITQRLPEDTGQRAIPLEKTICDKDEHIFPKHLTDMSIIITSDYLLQENDI